MNCGLHISCCSCYLGLALALQKNSAGDRAKEAIVYLLAGMESLLQHDVSLALQHGEPQYVTSPSVRFVVCFIQSMSTVCPLQMLAITVIL